MSLLSATAPSPSFIVDLEKLEANLRVLAEVKQAADCNIVLALKGFALWHTFPLVGKHLDGCCASGIWEAKLSHEHMGKHTLTYSPAYKPAEINELLEFTSHIDFNSITQWYTFREQVTSHPRFLSSELKCGIRINPEHSTGETPAYDPCGPCSRLGATAATLTDADLTGISGLHFHTLCEQYTGDLATTLEAIDEKFGDLLRRPEITWLNMGGGHWITKPDYDRKHLIKLIQETRELYDLTDIWLEPGEAVAIHTGVLKSTVIDIVENGPHQIAILDVSATAHMPDTLEMPYRPDLLTADGSIAGQPNEFQHTYIIGGPTCLAGDSVGTYSFTDPLSIGDELFFDDMTHYTMVKTTTFNGVPHPAIVTTDSTGNEQVLREFTYQDFKNRLG